MICDSVFIHVIMITVAVLVLCDKETQLAEVRIKHLLSMILTVTVRGCVCADYQSFQMTLLLPTNGEQIGRYIST